MLKAQDSTDKSAAPNMARSLFGRPTTPAPVPAPKPMGSPVPTTASNTLQSPPISPAKKEAVGGNRLLVGPDVKLKGAEILDCDTLVVEGRVEATMDSHVIQIAEQGIFCGTVSIDTAEIHGTFEGELTARSQLVIHGTGRVTGKIRYGKILIEEGGQICGDIQSTAAGQESGGVSVQGSKPEVRTLGAVARL